MHTQQCCCAAATTPRQNMLIVSQSHDKHAGVLRPRNASTLLGAPAQPRTHVHTHSLWRQLLLPAPPPAASSFRCCCTAAKLQAERAYTWRWFTGRHSLAEDGRCTSMLATCTWRLASNAHMRMYALGKALVALSISRSTYERTRENSSSSRERSRVSFLSVLLFFPGCGKSSAARQRMGQRQLAYWNACITFRQPARR